MKKAVDNDRLRGMIRDYMRIHRLNQNEFGAKLGVTGVTVGYWLSGEHGITRTNAERILSLCQPPAIHQQGSGHAVMSVYGDANGGGVAKSALDALERRILEDDGICDACKLRVLSLIKSITN